MLENSLGFALEKVGSGGGGEGGAHGIFAPTTPSLSYAVRV